MELSVSHKESKQDSYWKNLVAGDTGAYKCERIKELVTAHFTATGINVLDIGCGTCEVAFAYSSELKAKKIVCMDYDPKVLEVLRSKHGERGVEWRVQDILRLEASAERFDLIFMLDMLHEVYSFYGRPKDDPKAPIDHAIGLKFVRTALRNISQILSPRGGLIITDNVLPDEDGPVQIRLRNPEVARAFNFLLEDFPSRRINCRFTGNDTFEINARDLSVVLTQYNKIKQNNTARWNVERLEVHQYMTLAEYDDCLKGLGLEVHAVVGTPDSARREWETDFEITHGLECFPHKRITLLAIKR